MMSGRTIQPERVCRAESRLPRKPVYVPLAKTINVFDDDFERVKI